MTKKNIFLILLVLLLASFSLYLNRDRFRGDSIRIGDRWVAPRPWMTRPGQTPPSQVLLFLLDSERPITSIKVIPVSDIETNKYPHPIWDLVTDSNSVPVKEFYYGRTVRGMKPSVKGAIADPLEANVRYRLFVEAGSVKGQHDFVGR